MSTVGVLNINHRELVLSARRKARFAFLRMPHDLQDRIITGMDSGAITLHQGSQFALQNGFRLSYEAISRYYIAVRERRADLLSRIAA